MLRRVTERTLDCICKTLTLTPVDDCEKRTERVGDKTFATRCDLCNADLLTPHNAKSHYLGMRHKKEIKKHLDKLREEGQMVPNHGVKMGRGQDGPQIGISFTGDKSKSKSSEARPAQHEKEDYSSLTLPNNDEPPEEGSKSG